MFKNTFQSGFLSILYSIGSKPLQIWDKKVRNGHIKRITDNDIQSLVLEIVGTNVSTTYITCPADPKITLGIKLPFLVMIIKNMKKYFTFEVQVLDDKNVRRRFRASNYQSTTRVKPFICTMPMRLDDGWNQIQFNLSDFTRRAYGTNYIETLRVQIHANCRIRRVYFSDRLYSEDELPAEDNNSVVCWTLCVIYVLRRQRERPGRTEPEALRVKMFKNTFQSGFLSILYSIGSKPLQIWDKKVRNGHIKRITDNDIQSLVLEIVGTNVSTTYITCPADPKITLGIKLPFLVMIIKNMKKYFTFEVQVLDDKNVRRRFRASNYQSTTRVKPFICTMPMRLDDGWNQIQFNLSDFTRRAYGTNYIETLRVQIHANCRIRRVYFSDRLYSEDELPAEFKLYLPVQNKMKANAN
eukprot:sb/3465194/